MSVKFDNTAFPYANVVSVKKLFFSLPRGTATSRQ